MELVYTAPTKAFVLIKIALKSLHKFFLALGASIAKSQQLRADYWILQHMSDRDLKDVGITRGEIKARFDSK